MEPRRDDGDDAAMGILAARPRTAAMEPRRDDGDDHHLRGRGDQRIHAAMEPRRDDGDDHMLLDTEKSTSWGRNGAPS